MILVILFFLFVYGFIGWMFSGIFRDWFRLLLDYNREVADAAGTMAAVFWPLGWVLIIVVGIYYACKIVYGKARGGWRKITHSYRVLANHYREAESGN